MIALNGTVQQEGAWVLNWATNEGQICNDINVICCCIKKQFFEKSVVVWNKSALTKNGVFHKINCRWAPDDGQQRGSRRVHEHVVAKDGKIICQMDGKEMQQNIPSHPGWVHEQVALFTSSLLVC
jgi:hypothetical protein